jgi:hypothetical protein
MRRGRLFVVNVVVVVVHATRLASHQRSIIFDLLFGDSDDRHVSFGDCNSISFTVSAGI